MKTKRNQRPRSAASKAVIALREALGKTQFEFAAFVAKTSLITITRWEHSRPPTGDALMRLRDVAKKHGRHSLAMDFEFLYLDEVPANLGPNAKIRKAGSAKTGYIIWNEADNSAPNSGDFFRNAAADLIELAEEIERIKEQH